MSGETAVGTKNDGETDLMLLISCLRHNVDGKIDYAEVAKERSIVTPAAAAKRLERLLKKHKVPSLNPRGGRKAGKGRVDSGEDKENEDDSFVEKGKSPKTTPVKGRRTKKRRLEEEKEEDQERGELKEEFEFEGLEE